MYTKFSSRILNLGSHPIFSMDPYRLEICSICVSLQLLSTSVQKVHIFPMGKSYEKGASANAKMSPSCHPGAPQPLGHLREWWPWGPGQVAAYAAVICGHQRGHQRHHQHQVGRPTDPTDTQLTYKLYGGKFRLWGDRGSSTASKVPAGKYSTVCIIGTTKFSSRYWYYYLWY